MQPATNTTGHVGFTGTRRGMTPEQQAKVELFLTSLHRLGARWFHHGCAGGADREAGEIAARVGFLVVGHPGPDSPHVGGWDELRERKASYLDRDHDIVVETSALIATPRGYVEERRSGTWATIRFARRNKRPQLIVWPDGNSTWEWEVDR